ncbi:hypothetical protein [Nonomuraea sp. NPDC049758]|uniref:hypothetical protein n=1 Tax=Nonomuraea sp. NPDC049758 TaxID=3154360 RepID=UPI003449A377
MSSLIRTGVNGPDGAPASRPGSPARKAASWEEADRRRFGAYLGRLADDVGA